MLRTQCIFILLIFNITRIYGEESFSEAKSPTLTPLARKAIEGADQRQLILNNCNEKYGEEFFKRTVFLKDKIDSLLNKEHDIVNNLQDNSHMSLILKNIKDIEHLELATIKDPSLKKSSYKELELKRLDAIKQLQKENMKIEQDTELVKIRKMIKATQEAINDSISNIIGDDEICKQCYKLNR